MFQPIKKLVQFTSSQKGAKITLLIWLAIIIILSGVAPTAKQYADNSSEGSVQENTPSEVAEQLLNEQFPSKEGLTALLVFHQKDPLTQKEIDQITKISQWLSSDQKPEHVASALPFHQFPKPIQDQLFSEDKTTLLFNIALEKDLDSDLVYETLQEVEKKVKEIGIGNMQFEITGPAGISADTITIFKNADFVLMLATIGLILVILLFIYRSPLLAITPLLIAAAVYQVVDRILGLAGKNDWFVVENQAISIMLILLFAVLTDYCLFIFSRFREELRKVDSKYEAMSEAISRVSEPILFSGGTVLMAMLTLFAAIFKPYNHFAPIFSVAIVVILIAGLTLIPSTFALMGRKAFWPFIPKKEGTKAQPKGIWNKIASFIMRKPFIPASILMIVLIGGAINASTINYSFNLLKSFPEDISSRQGFEILEEHYPKGELAPITVILKSEKEIELNSVFVKNIASLTKELQKQKGIDSVSPTAEELLQTPAKFPKNFLAEGKHAVKIKLVPKDNPYDQAAIDALQKLLDQKEDFLKTSGLNSSDYSLHFAGQTAKQLDVKQMNQRDTLWLFALVTVAITILLIFQTRSLVLPLVMIFTILLSYAGTLGFGWLIFHHLLGYDAISYRLPVYTFVFMVALGVDYNIMLVSRIREEAKKYPWREAVGRGVALTGGVISSAGTILAATFGVLITQPLQELFLFGLIMATGIMIDTFLVRGILLPSIMILIKGKPKNRHTDSTTLGA
ncbi:MMPL family transporter [Hazenella coriacea]|uniref:RND superfamily putative drug exporter n=1 Tax=Hazenella coriacea TaxID=1179467 RepID=A0A4R3LDA6_9BACL|nr:MMPL family transporter [Hazenella coriacea]TCS95456.1 RND superfamily putative drug exporter [Hazenella coriacea]